MRKLRGSDLFFSGVLLFCTLDHLQLRPIKGLPILLSPHIMSSFALMTLKHLVRASQDVHLQRIIDICRMSKDDYDAQPQLIGELKTLLKENCTWVDSWNSPEIPNNAIRCFGMRKPAQRAEARYIEQVRRDCQRNGRPFWTVRATDLEQAQQSHSPWKTATPIVVSQLNRKVREPEILAMFEFAVYEFTFNSPGAFSQTQLAVLCEVPTQEAMSTYQPIPILCAPPGTKNIDFQIESRQQLVDLGWTQVHAIAAPSFTMNLRAGMKGRRQQYGLRPHVSNTVHGAMGSTLSKVATEINVRGTGNQLWEKGQVVVLVSRTKTCKDLIFVGNQSATLDVITSLIQVETQYDKYIGHILNVLTTGSVPEGNSPCERVIQLSNHVLRPNDIALPEAGSGCCYLLVSTKNYRVTYIGQTRNHLTRRLHQHNSGRGGAQTNAHHLRPWGIIAFVTGFDGSVEHLLLFERLWEEKRQHRFMQLTLDLTTDDIVDIARDLITNLYFRYLNLRLVVAGRIVREGNE